MPQRVAPLSVAPLRSRLALVTGGLALAAAVAASAFWLGGRLATRPPSPPAVGAPPELAQRLASLEDALAGERAARESLAAELATLNARIATAREAPGRAGADPAREPREEERAREPGGETESAAPLATAAPVFDVAALVAGGCMRRDDADALRARWERYQLDRLQMNDRAMRSGYFMTPRHRNEQAALEAAFRDELGEEGYDAYLRATGKPNRFALRELFLGGAGTAAGLEAGDELLRYDGVRVFSTADLQLLTSAGRPGELVPIEVIRGGQPLTLRAARGPLGVVLDGVVREPEGGCAP